MAARATTRKLATRVTRKAPRRRNSVTWEEDDASLVQQAQTSRSAEELARLRNYAVSHRDSKLKAAVDKRAAQLRIKPAELKWNPDSHALYYTAVKADHAWQKALEEKYRSAAGDARYDKRGKATPKLARLHSRYRKLSDKLSKQTLGNPASASAEVFEEFHGHPPSEVVKVTREIHRHAHLAALGTLVSLEVWGVDERGHKITGFRKAILASNEDRNQLFIEGGDQSVNLKDFGIKAAHEFETLGRVTGIAYQTNKSHLGKEGGEAVYVHRFRSTNENGKHVMVKMTREPDLVYDVRNEQLLFSGGSYEILREGIDK